MRIRSLMMVLILLLAVNIPLQWSTLRWDLTQDQRYTLSAPTRQLIQSLDQPLTAEVLLTGKLNSGFSRLRKASIEMLEELGHDCKVNIVYPDPEKIDSYRLTPTLIHERSQNGQTIQTQVYPYLRLSYAGRHRIVSLLQNNRGKSGEENLNSSIENLEYAIAEAIGSLTQEKVEKIAFLEGHGEWNEHDVWDMSQQLAHYFQIDRGELGNEVGILDNYKVVIIAGPQRPFSDRDKYILDQYLMQGGRLLWLVDGVRFSSEMLSDEGKTPVIPLDLNLTDLWFRYGVRLNPVLIQDLQCLRIPVDMGQNGQENYQPIPWTYAPLLLTSQASPITRNVMQVRSEMMSALDMVGGEDGLSKEILLATSSASRITGTPGEVDLSDIHIQQDEYHYQFLPAAMLVEGSFTSLYAHLMAPQGIVSSQPALRQSKETRQIFVAGSSIARNDWSQGHALPVGYDRYTQTQFGNRDFLIHAVLYLSDESGLIALRAKSFPLRLINDQRSHQYRLSIQIISIALPLILLAMIGLIQWGIRKKKYTL